MDRRSLLKGMWLSPLVATNSTKAIQVIPDDYEVDFELHGPHGNYWFDCDKDENGFVLEIMLEGGRGYEGPLQWWIVPPQDFEVGRRDRAYSTGVAQASIPEDSVTGDSIVKVTFI